MILIWGWKVRFATLEQGGVFFCPNCGGDCQYSRQQGRRWFTLFFIPLIPLGYVGGEFVECERCKSAYDPAVLSQPTTSGLSEQLVFATRMALVWLLRLSGPTPRSSAAATEVLSSTAGRAWSDQELQADFANLQVDALSSHLAGLAGMLNEHGKESFLNGCIHVAMADGTLSDQACAVVNHVAAGLTMSPAHAAGVIGQVSQGTAPSY